MFSRKIWMALAIAPALGLAVPATAQLNFSEGYKFLKAVKDSNGQDLTDILNKPGSAIIDTKDPSTGEGALDIVVKRGDAAYLRFLLQHHADPNIRDNQGVTPLLLAVNQRQDPCLQILLQAGANVNLANDRGETPLIRAVQMRNANMVRELLVAGADPDQADHLAGLSARDYAHNDTRSPMIAKLLADAPKKSHADVAGPKL